MEIESSDSNSFLDDCETDEDAMDTQESYNAFSFINGVDKNAWGMLLSTNPKYPNIQFIEKETITIGRAETCTHVIEDLRISSIHCLISRKVDLTSDFDTSYISVEDYSTNGTFINGKRLEKGVPKEFHNSDQISFLSTGLDPNLDIPHYIFKNFDVIPQDHISDSAFFQNYDLKIALGEGQFSKVFLAIEKSTGMNYAVKIIDIAKYLPFQFKPFRNQPMDEVNIMKKITHENIVRVKDVFVTEQNIYIVLELCKGGELSKRLQKRGKYSESNSKIVFRKLLSAVSYIHAKNIAHRDLKLENILLVSLESDTDIKLADFGYSRFVLSGNMSTFAGTQNYVAPEVILDSNRHGYSKSCDIWSCGIILYVLLTGSFPFIYSPNEKPINKQIRDGDIHFPSEKFQGISDKAIDLIQKCLIMDPKLRITADEVLEHSWFFEN
ncbi:serine/threonine-protein kinase fhke-related [Anaeramoeba ignava]|uniref:Serine/threonine-protein kinase fhke-related n=1 Tax=Anaeramoeba ignava TaxID=1746090 RepID=A0A9Q0L5N9_ANAIG|nr:serine/threonine-protein kinase fhke-related [Anaeramoeba ignava]